MNAALLAIAAYLAVGVACFGWSWFRVAAFADLPVAFAVRARAVLDGKPVPSLLQARLAVLWFLVTIAYVAGWPFGLYRAIVQAREIRRFEAEDDDHREAARLEWEAPLSGDPAEATLGELWQRRTGRKLEECLPLLQAITLERSWFGLSEFSTKNTLDLIPEGDAASARVFHSLGPGPYAVREMGLPLTRSENVRIPIHVVETFLATIGAAELVREKYVPYEEISDSSPITRISLRFSLGACLVWSESQGPMAVPWAAEIDGTKWTVPDEAPARAVDLFSPYLRPEVTKEMISELDASPAVQDGRERALVEGDYVGFLAPRS